MWSVRFAESPDTNKVLQVQRKAFRDYQKNYRVRLAALEETPEQIAEDIARNRVLVATDGDEVIGSLRYHVDREKLTAEVFLLAVDPAYAHLAVGRSLMARAEAEAISQQANVMLAEIGLRDAPAVEFYYRLGYRPVELRTDEHDVDRVLFRKSLT